MSDESQTEVKVLAIRLDGLQAVLQERDRRYSEVKSAEEKALKVKEQADRDALDLARQIQIYKDEKANELRAQINSERGLYVTRMDLSSAIKEIQATVDPLVRYVSAQRGEAGGIANSRNMVTWLIGLIGFVIMFGGMLIGIVIFVVEKKP